MMFVSLDFHYKLIQKKKLKRIYILFALVVTYFSSWLPDFENVLGVEGARISSVAAFGVFNGMFLGPYWGAAVSFSGIMAHVMTRSSFLEGSTFKLLTPLFVMVASIIAGLLVTKKEKVAVLLYSSLIASWYLFETGRQAYYHPWFHVLALLMLVIFCKFYRSRAREVNIFGFIMLFLASLVAILSDHMAGCIAALYLYDLPAEMFLSVVLIYPIERSVLAFCAALIMFMLAMMVKQAVMGVDLVDEDVEREKMNDLLSYVENDVMDIIEQESKKK